MKPFLVSEGCRENFGLNQTINALNKKCYYLDKIIEIQINNKRRQSEDYERFAINTRKN